MRPVSFIAKPLHIQHLQMGSLPACIVRFRHRLKTYQDRTQSNFESRIGGFLAQHNDTAFELKITQMQDQISELTTRLAEREAGKLSQFTYRDAFGTSILTARTSAPTQTSQQYLRTWKQPLPDLRPKNDRRKPLPFR